MSLDLAKHIPIENYTLTYSMSVAHKAHDTLVTRARHHTWQSSDTNCTGMLSQMDDMPTTNKSTIRGSLEY
jgi:hypothetical protein